MIPRPSPTRLLLAGAIMAVLAAMPARAIAQEEAIPLMDPQEEAVLALSAAPPQVAQGAAVWVLGPQGYQRTREGTNGWSCLVERDHPRSLAPLCYAPAASESVLPGALELARLRQSGMTYDQAKASVLRDMERGVLAVPARPALSFMFSPHQSLYSAPDGEPVGAWLPHVMIHFPGMTNAELGLVPGGPQGWVQDEGLPTAYLVIPVGAWSDGTPAGGGG